LTLAFSLDSIFNLAFFEQLFVGTRGIAFVCVQAPQNRGFFQNGFELLHFCFVGRCHVNMGPTNPSSASRNHKALVSKVAPLPVPPLRFSSKITLNAQLVAQGCQVEKSKGCGCGPNPVCGPSVKAWEAVEGVSQRLTRCPKNQSCRRIRMPPGAKKGPRATLRKIQKNRIYELAIVLGNPSAAPCSSWEKWL